MSKSRFTSMVPTPETGGFAEAVQSAMDKKGINTVELAEALDVSYEHARKLLNSMAFPSAILVAKICRVLGMDRSETERVLVADRIRRKYGTATPMPAPRARDPRFARLERKLSSLTAEQFDTLSQLIDTMIKANRTP